MPLAVFAFVIFQIGSCAFALGWPQTMIHWLMPPTIAGITGSYHHAQLIFRDGSSWGFFAKAGFKTRASWSLPSE
jgi:hypothetical protein